MQLYLADRGVFHDATDLIARFGDDAGFEAADRADRGRNVGNVTTFCRWRQIERLILLFSAEQAIGTVH